MYELAITLKEAGLGAKKQLSFSSGKNDRKGYGQNSPRNLYRQETSHTRKRGGRPGRRSHREMCLLEFKVLEDPVLKAEEQNLVVEKEIGSAQAVLGTHVEVPTLDGKSLQVKIPPGTQAQSRLRLKGYGLPILGAKGKGDLFVKILIKIPKKLSDRQKKLVEELAQEEL